MRGFVFGSCGNNTAANLALFSSLILCLQLQINIFGKKKKQTKSLKHAATTKVSTVRHGSSRGHGDHYCTLIHFDNSAAECMVCPSIATCHTTAICDNRYIRLSVAIVSLDSLPDQQCEAIDRCSGYGS